MTQHPPGLIALSTGELARYATCLASIEGLQRPAGTRRLTTSSLSIANNWNYAAEKMLEDPQLRWLFLLNDDHLYPADTLMKLLDRQVDVVTGLYTRRVAPFEPNLYVLSEDGFHIRPVQWPEVDVAQLVQVDACGDGCLLIRRTVLEQMPSPWWAYGAVDNDKVDHDVVFSARLRDAGFTIHTDLNTVVDHNTTLGLRPVHQADGSWTLHIVDRQDNAIAVPLTQKEKVHP